MDTIATNVELLYKEAKKYAEINIELAKLNAIDKTADVVSSLVSRMVIIMVVAMFLLLLNITLGLYLGELLGKDYLGFLAVTMINLLFALFLNYNRDKILKTRITNVVIAKLLKKKSVSNAPKNES